jgi:hypothetical protein
MSTDLIIVYRGEYIRGMLNGNAVLTQDPDLAKPFNDEGAAWYFAAQNNLRPDFCAVTTRPDRAAQKS